MKIREVLKLTKPYLPEVLDRSRPIEPKQWSPEFRHQIGSHDGENGCQQRTALLPQTLTMA
jgi:hypothetical protein